jgi:hypothetical protein
MAAQSGKTAILLENTRARLEGLEPPTRCLEGSWATVLTGNI